MSDISFDYTTGFEFLAITLDPSGVLEVALNRPKKFNAINFKGIV